MATPRVRDASAASPAELAPHLPRALPTPVGRAVLSLVPSSFLSARAKETLYALFESNMGSLAADTSMAFERPSKLEEMFHPDARYLLVTRADTMPGALPPTPPRPRATRSATAEAEIDVLPEDLLGYASFRFDTEETMGIDDVEVIYCYELQLVPKARGTGLAPALMAELEAIGAARGMAKSMLTCLVDNTAAMAFYTKAGYTADEIDPARVADEDGWEDVDAEGEERHPDYRILSKPLFSP